MITMVDQLYDRNYQAARGQLNEALLSVAKSFANAFANAFKVLNRIEYAAPWTVKPRRVRFR